MRKIYILVAITIWFIGGIISLRLGFPVCVTPGNEASGFMIPMTEIKQALSSFDIPSDWIPPEQHIIRKDKLNGIDGLINAFAYYEGFFLALIVTLPKIVPFFNEMFSGGLWPILRGVLEIIVILPS